MQQNVKEKNPGIFRSEMALWIGVATALVFLAVGKSWLMDLSNPLKYGFFFIWLWHGIHTLNPCQILKICVCNIWPDSYQN